MQYLYLATHRLDACSSEWLGYVAWRGLPQLTEVVTINTIVDAGLLSNEDWRHIASYEDVDRHGPYFTEFQRLLEYLNLVIPEYELDVARLNILCAVREPTESPVPPFAWPAFELLGYDLVDRAMCISQLTNCGRHDFDAELNASGLLPTLTRARQLQAELLLDHPVVDPHANCSVWAIFRLIETHFLAEH